MTRPLRYERSAESLEWCDNYHDPEEVDACIDELTAERDLLREVLQWLYDTSDATPGTAQWEDYELAIRQAEAALKGVKEKPGLCEECGKYPADTPSTLCAGCDAYAEHQGG